MNKNTVGMVTLGFQVLAIVGTFSFSEVGLALAVFFLNCALICLWSQWGKIR